MASACISAARSTAAVSVEKKGEPLPNLGRALNELPGMACRVKIVKTKGKGAKAETTYTNIRYLEKKPAANKWGGGF